MKWWQTLFAKPNLHSPVLHIAGNLLDDEVALDWLTTQATSESVEEVTPIVLSKLVGDARRLAVLFCEYGRALID